MKEIHGYTHPSDQIKIIGEIKKAFDQTPLKALQKRINNGEILKE